MICTPNTGHPVLGVHIKTEKQKVVFARRICTRRAARLSREWLPVLPKSRTLPGKKHRKTASAIYSAVSYRFYNVFCKKSMDRQEVLIFYRQCGFRRLCNIEKLSIMVGVYDENSDVKWEADDERIAVGDQREIYPFQSGNLQPE